MADLDGVCPYLLERVDQLQHFDIGEDGLLSALDVCTPQLQVVLLGDQVRLRLAVFFDGVSQKFFERQAVLHPGLRHLDPRCECLALLDPSFLIDPLMAQDTLC